MPVAKYRNVKTERDGFTFDSKREADHWTELRLLEKAGKIRNLSRQNVYELRAEDCGGGGGKFGTYAADFVFEEFVTIPAKTFRGKVKEPARQEWQPVVADSKGFKTEAYALKKRVLKAQYGVKIREM